MRLVRSIAWLIGLSIGALQAWLTRQQLSSDDAIAYLDIGDAYMRGDWHTAINAYWSPLYSWILGATMRVFHPSADLEFPVVKVVNLAIVIFAFSCFEFFWRRMERFAASRNAFPLSNVVRSGLAYGLFLWTALTFIGVSSDTPDMLVAAMTYLAAGVLLDLVQRPSLARSAILGVILALGFLAKAALFPMALVFLAVAIVATRKARSFAVAALAFAALAGPFIAAISQEKGRLTFGDTGRLNFVWAMSRDVRPFRFWVRDTLGSPPAHPVRVISDQPAVYEFAQPVGGTYPAWHDPSYWYEGLRVHLRPALLFTAIASNLWFYAARFGLWFVGGWLALVGTSALARSARSLTSFWPILIPALCGLGLYLIGSDMVAGMIPTQPSTRFIAAFVVLLGCALVSSATKAANEKQTRYAAGALFAVLCWSLAWNTSQRIVDSNDEPSRIARQQVAIASKLRSAGLMPGDRIAVAGFYFFPYFHWARLDRVRIVAEIYDADSFWEQPADRRSQIIAAIKRTGARAIVQRSGVRAPLEPAWRPVGFDYYILWL